MKVLFLDIASSSALLACSTEELVVAHRMLDHRISDHELVPLIEEVLEEAGWSYKDLTHLACVIGPGGFTSLRVGVSCMNALSWALEIPSTGIHLSDLYAMRVAVARHPEVRAGCMDSWLLRSASEHLTMTPCEPRMGATSFLWLHSTKRTELFIRGFGDFAKRWPQPTHITLDDLVSKLQSPTTYTGELLPEHRTLIEEVGGVMLSLCPVSDILPPFLLSLTYQTQILEPWYGRGW